MKIKIKHCSKKYRNWKARYKKQRDLLVSYPKGQSQKLNLKKSNN